MTGIAGFNYRMLNLEGDKQLGGEDVKAEDKENLNLTDGLSQKELETIDANNDGVITQNEYIDAAEQQKIDEKTAQNYFQTLTMFTNAFSSNNGRTIAQQSSDGKTQVITNFTSSGNVSSSTETITAEDGSKTVSERDKNGNIKTITKYNTDGSTEETKVSSNGTRTTTCKNSSGAITAVIAANKNGIETRTDYENGKIKLKTITDKDGNISYKSGTVTETDEKGNEIKTTYNSAGKVTQKVITASDGSEIIEKYSSSGKINSKIETNTKSDGSKEVTETKYKSNGNVNTTTVTETMPDGSKTVTRTDAAGKVIKNHFDKDGKQISYSNYNAKGAGSEWVKDENGNLISQSRTSSNGQTTETKYSNNGSGDYERYVTDKGGNVLRKITKTTQDDGSSHIENQQASKKPSSELSAEAIESFNSFTETEGAQWSYTIEGSTDKERADDALKFAQTYIQSQGDKDDIMSAEEFIALNQTEGLSEDDLKQIYNLIDNNGRGGITAQEYAAYLTAVDAMDGEVDGIVKNECYQDSAAFAVYSNMQELKGTDLGETAKAGLDTLKLLINAAEEYYIKPAVHEQYDYKTTSTTDSTKEGSTRKTYDEDGNVQTETETYNDPSKHDDVKSKTTTNNADGTKTVEAEKSDGTKITQTSGKSEVEVITHSDKTKSIITRDEEGNVKTENYNAKGVKTSEKTEFKTPDNEGRTSVETVYNGSVKSVVSNYKNGAKVTEDYSDKGQLKLRVKTSSDGAKITEKYNADGKLASKETITPSGSKTTVNYNADGKLSSKERKTADGSRTIENYNEQGVLTDKTTYKADGKTVEERYNDKGHIIKKTTRYNDGSSVIAGYYNNKLSSKTTTKKDGTKINESFNSQGYITYSETVEKNGKKTYAHFQNGIITDKTIEYKDSTGKYETFYYDDAGKLKASLTTQTIGGAHYSSEQLYGGKKVTGNQGNYNSNSSGVNGKIDQRVRQSGETGDCYLISGVMALSSTPKGAEIIRNSIKANPDGSVTVTFAGAGKSYTISKSEIQQHDTDNNLSDAFSNGDNDMLAIELAFDKLCRGTGISKGDIEAGLSREIWQALIPNYNTSVIVPSGDTSIDLSTEAVKAMLQKAINNPNTILAFGLFGPRTHSAECTDGSLFNLKINGGHMLYVQNVTKNTVTIANPWDTSVTYTMTWDEFAKIGIHQIESVDVSNA